jgi:hypothetical protein
MLIIIIFTMAADALYPHIKGRLIASVEFPQLYSKLAAENLQQKHVCMAILKFTLLFKRAKPTVRVLKPIVLRAMSRNLSLIACQSFCVPKMTYINFSDQRFQQK